MEHSVFLGDFQHNQSNTFEKFLSEHNGYSNAFTSQENTNYYYKVSSEKLEESLARFTELLSNPLLQLDDMQRELHALESEFLKDKLESARQVWRLIKHLANEDHPFHRLSPGNLATLGGLNNSSIIRDFHSQYYIPENMQCVLYGREDPQDLLEMSRRYFIKIKRSFPPSQSVPLGTIASVPVYLSDVLGMVVTYKPLRKGNDLAIIWPVTGSSRCGIGTVVSILSERHSKSALTFLKKQGLATGITWYTIISAHSFSVLRVDVKLTEMGQANYALVVKVIFKQIQITLTESSSKSHAWLKRIHQETLQNFINQEKQEVHHFVKTLSSRMSKVLHPAYLLGAPVQAPTAQCLSATLEFLTPMNSIIFLGSTSRKEDFYEKEPWYEIPYSTLKLTEMNLRALQSTSKYEGEIKSLPEDYTTISRTFPLYERDLEQQRWPTELHDEDGLTVWWQQDYTFHTPRIDTVLWGHAHQEHSTAREVALHFLLVEMFRDQLEDRVQWGGNHVELHYQSSSGFILRMSGYSDHEKMMRFMKDVVNVMVKLDVSRNVNEKFVHVVKYKALTELARSDYAEAYKHPLYKSRVLLEKNVVPLNEIVSEVKKISLASFADFYRNFWQDIGYKCLIYGNVLKSMALEYSLILNTLVLRTTSSGSVAVNKPPFHPTIQYPSGTYYTITPYPNSDETASVADLAIILGPTPWNSDTITADKRLFTRTAMARIAATILTEPVFIELRTRQQLGYAVITKFISHFGIDYIHLCIQGSENSAVTMANSILSFLIEYRSTLTNLLVADNPDSKAYWKSIISSVRQDMQVKPLTQVSMAMSLAAELFSPDPLPDRGDVMTGTLETITPEMLLQFYDEYILGGSSRRVVSLAQSQHRPWNMTELGHKVKFLDWRDKEAHGSPFLYWHFSYLGLEMGK